MARPLFFRALCLVLVSLVLMSPTLVALDRASHKDAKPETLSFVSRAWAGLKSLFGALGSEMDPNGLATNQSGHTGGGNRLASDNGSTMDPDGKK